MKRRFSESADVDWHSGWENGETPEELSARVVPTLLALGTHHPDERVLGVTHAGPIRAALSAAMGLSHEEARLHIGPLANGAIYRFAVRDGSLERVD